MSLSQGTTPPAFSALPPQNAGGEVSFGIMTLAPPVLDRRVILPRANDVNNVLRILGSAQISTVALAGEAGAGKSTLAALAFQQLQAAAQAAQAGSSPPSPFRHFIWLGLGASSNIPDCLAALLSSIRPAGAPVNTRENALPPHFMHFKPDQQLAYTLQVLRQPQASSLIVIDQLEDVLDSGSGRALPGRGALTLFFEMLKQDLGTSRVLLTCHHSPFAPQNDETSRARTWQVSQITMPESIALLQQRGVAGAPQELSLVRQRCAGNAYALALFAALFNLSGFSLSYLLNAPDFQFMWNGDVPLNLAGMVYNFLNPIQRTLLRALCLFNEPVPVSAILAAITGADQTADTKLFERELALLTRLALVQYVPGDRREYGETGHVRYFLHARIRQYTIEHYLEGQERRSSSVQRSAVGVADQPNPLNADPEAREVALAAGHMRVATYYAHLFRKRYVPQEQRRGPLDVAPLISVIEHLCLGWHWQSAYDLLLEEKLHERLAQWGEWDTLIRLYTAMIPPAGIVARSGEAFICSHLGLLYGRLDDYQASDYYFRRALDTQREIHDLRGEVATLINYGELLRSAGQGQQARATFERARHLLQSLNSPDAPANAGLECALLHNMGLLAQDEKNYREALHYYLDAQKLARTLPKTAKLGIILTSLGMLFFEQGQLPEALSLLLQAVQIRQAAQDPTLNTLTHFLKALEQKMGPASYAALQREAERLQSPTPP
jgi:Tfp pilus assembly protein PilF